MGRELSIIYSKNDQVTDLSKQIAITSILLKLIKNQIKKDTSKLIIDAFTNLIEAFDNTILKEYYPISKKAAVIKKLGKYIFSPWTLEQVSLQSFFNDLFDERLFRENISTNTDFYKIILYLYQPVLNALKKGSELNKIEVFRMGSYENQELSDSEIRFFVAIKNVSMNPRIQTSFFDGLTDLLESIKDFQASDSEPIYYLFEDEIYPGILDAIDTFDALPAGSVD